MWRGEGIITQNQFSECQTKSGLEIIGFKLHYFANDIVKPESDSVEGL